MKKLLFVITVALCLIACERNTPDSSTYVDLGLSSGTKWKSTNEINPDDGNDFYDYDAAMAQFGKSIPSKVQWLELVNECTWDWTGMGYRVTGPNGKSIVLPAAGYGRGIGSVYEIGKGGVYWSSTPNGSEEAYELDFTSTGIGMYNVTRYNCLSVRLVR